MGACVNVARVECAHHVHAAFEDELERALSELDGDDSDDERLDGLREDWRRASDPFDPKPMLGWLIAHPRRVLGLFNVHTPVVHARLNKS
jgi:hypothetical protein